MVEKDLDGFTSQIIENDNGFTVINTANPKEPEISEEYPVEPTEPEEPPVEEPETPVEPPVEEVLGVSRDPQTPKEDESLPEVE